MNFKKKLEENLGLKIINPFEIPLPKKIEKTLVITENNDRFFLKYCNPDNATCLNALAAEVSGLDELNRTRSDFFRTPRIILHDKNFILFEYIESVAPHEHHYHKLVQALSEIHGYKSETFGFNASNFIGENVQFNHPHKNWSHFFKSQRLEPQMFLARDKLSSKMFKDLEILCDKLDQILNHSLHPSLLHGDLWSGNILYTESGEVILIDPAVYYGDPLAEFSIMELFGGLPARFYDHYGGQFLNNEKEQTRFVIYQIYHALNHFNLFGVSYLSLLEKLLKQLKA